MKRCPTCRRDYYDDTLNYCLEDGAALVHGIAADGPVTARFGPVPSPGEPVTQVFAAGNESRLAAGHSIAVLPFANISADAENEYFCDGLAEELLGALAKIDGLKVAARTSAFSFKGKNANVSDIGIALGVKTVLEGSVRKAGKRVRITVQLVDAKEGYQIWSERYDREIRSIFDIQDEIALAVVDALKIKLFGDERAAVLKRYTDSTEAYELYLKGRFQYHKCTPEGWLKAIEFLEKAIDAEPGYAPAFTTISFACSYLWYFELIPPAEIVSKWKAVTERALEIDESLDEAHGALGEYEFWYERNWEKAERAFLRALELGPNNPETYHQYGLCLALVGRGEEGFKFAARSLEMDPLSLLVSHQVGATYLFSGHLDEAFDLASKMLEMEPAFDIAYWVRGMVFRARGKCDDALDAFQTTYSLSSQPMVLGHIGSLLGQMGRTREAHSILDQLLDLRKQRPFAAFNIARVYIGLGDNDQAIEWLERSLEERNADLPMLGAYVTVGIERSEANDLAGDPRYQAILDRIGLPAYKNKSFDRGAPPSQGLAKQPR